MTKEKTKAELAEIEELRFRLQEAEETLQAIRSGGVDALVVSMPEGVTEDNEYCIAELRNGITEVTQIIVAFKDFIGAGTPINKPSLTPKGQARSSVGDSVKAQL